MFPSRILGAVYGMWGRGSGVEHTAVQWDLIYCNFKQNTIRTFFKIYLFDMELN